MLYHNNPVTCVYLQDCHDLHALRTCRWFTLGCHLLSALGLVRTPWSDAETLAVTQAGTERGKMYNTKVALLMEAIKILDQEKVHYSLPTMKNRDESAGSSHHP